MTAWKGTRRRLLELSVAGTVGAVAGCSGVADPLGSTNGSESPPAPGNETVPESAEGELTLETDFRSRQRYRRPGEPFEAVEDPSAWTVVSGSMETDTDVVFDGDRSLKLSADGDENVVVRADLDDVDLTDLDFSFALRTTTPGNVAVSLDFVDVFGSRRVHQLRQISYRTPDVGWFRANPGVFQDSEVATMMDELDRVELVVLNTGPEAEVWIDDVRTHEKPDRGAVVLCWDDGRQSFYDEASPLHDEFGFNAVQGPISGRVRGRYMSVDALHDRQEAGDEIVMHGTHEPIHEYDEEAIEPRLRRDKQWFIDNDLRGADFIIYPHNSFDATSLEHIGKYHYCGGFNQSGDVNTTGIHGFDPLVLPRTIGHDLDIARRCVDVAAAHRNCTILNFHAFEEDNTMSEADYRELLEHVDGKGSDLEVLTLGDLWERRMAGH